MLSWQQVDAARIILEELYTFPLTGVLAQARLTGAMSIALVTNAFAESKLDPSIQSGFIDPRTGVREDSWGLFQANRTAGIGRGLSVAQLQDPRFSTNLILGEMLAQDQRTGLISRAARTGTAADMVAIFAQEVERPAGRHQKGRERAVLARKMWGPAAVDLPAL